jgi:aubergine
VFEYEVVFQPAVDSMNVRHRYLGAQIKELGVQAKTFDGQTLYLPIKLPDRVTVLHAKNDVDQSNVVINVIFKKQKRLCECMHLYNVLFDRIMRILNYVKFDRKKFDPTAPKLIPQHKLEIWPGYVTAVDEYEGGVMLCLDVSHRVLCQNTVLDHLINVFRKDKENYQENAVKSLLGELL